MALLPTAPKRACGSAEEAAAVSDPGLPENVWIAPCMRDVWGLILKLLGDEDWLAFRRTCRFFRRIAGQRWLGKLEKMKEWRAPGLRVNALCIWKDRLVTGDMNVDIQVWSTGCFDTETGRGEFYVTECLERVEMVLRGHTHTIQALLEWNGLLASSSYDTTIRLWDVDGNCVRVLQGHSYWVWCLALFQGRLASGSLDKTVRLWDFESGACVAVLRGHEKWVRCLAEFGSFLVSGSLDKTLRFWNSRGECMKLLNFDNWPYSLAVWGNLLVVGQWKGKIELVSAGGEHVKSSAIRSSNAGPLVWISALDPMHLAIYADNQLCVVRGNGSNVFNANLGDAKLLVCNEFLLCATLPNTFRLLSRVLSPKGFLFRL